jgi:hypothetical protein
MLGLAVRLGVRRVAVRALSCRGCGVTIQIAHPKAPGFLQPAILNRCVPSSLNQEH